MVYKKKNTTHISFLPIRIGKPATTPSIPDQIIHTQQKVFYHFVSNTTRLKYPCQALIFCQKSAEIIVRTRNYVTSNWQLGRLLITRYVLMWIARTQQFNVFFSNYNKKNYWGFSINWSIQISRNIDKTKSQLLV